MFNYSAKSVVKIIVGTVTVPQRCPVPPQLPARLQKAVTVDGLDRLITLLKEPAESSLKNETKSR